MDLKRNVRPPEGLKILYSINGQPLHVNNVSKQAETYLINAIAQTGQNQAID
jgi:hypothetical protein